VSENPVGLTTAVLVGGDLPVWKRSRFLGNTSGRREGTGLEGKKCVRGNSSRKRKEQMRTGKLIKEQKGFVSH